MRVLIGGCTVGGPSGVPDALMGYGEVNSRQFGFEIGEFAGLLRNTQPAVSDHRDARRVVSAILQTPQSRDDDITRIARADVANDSTHGEESKVCLVVAAHAPAR